MSILYLKTKSKKRKLTKAQLALQAEFQAMKVKWETAPKMSTKFPSSFSSSTKTARAKTAGQRIGERNEVGSTILSCTVEAETTRKKATYVPGVLAKKANPVYTGTECLGVAVMHKSNPIPVFNSEAAIDVAKMRRN